MTSKELEDYLRAQIPLTNALGVQVVRAEADICEVFAPLELNRNHLGTAFGGSLNSILLLACYTWLFNLLKEKGFDEHIVLKSSEIKYFLPVQEEIHAICKSPRENDLQKFLNAYEKKRRARIRLTATIAVKEGTACELTGEFVTLGGER